MEKKLFIFILLPVFVCQAMPPADASQSKVIPVTPEATRVSNYAGFESDREALAYALGADQGQGILRRAKYLKTIGVDLSNELIKRGFLDTFLDADRANTDPKAVKLNIEQMKTLIFDLSREKKKLEQALARAESQEQAVKGKIFLDDYSKNKGVKLTASGLQYRVLLSGAGAKPQFEDTVLVHYKGTYIDGRIFHESRYRGKEPLKFIVSEVIAGWAEALQMMRVGDKWEVVVPPSLGYGDSRHGDIPANSVLIFEIELMEILARNKNKD